MATLQGRPEDQVDGTNALDSLRDRLRAGFFSSPLSLPPARPDPATHIQAMKEYLQRLYNRKNITLPAALEKIESRATPSAPPPLVKPTERVDPRIFPIARQTPAQEKLMRGRTLLRASNDKKLPEMP